MLRGSRRLWNRISEEIPPPSTSIGRKIMRGIAIGGLAGGVLGLAIELSPEEMGLRKKTNEWISKGRHLVDTWEKPIKLAPSPPAPMVPTVPNPTPVPKPPLTAPKKPEGQDAEPMKPEVPDLKVAEEKPTSDLTESAPTEAPPADKGEPEPTTESTEPPILPEAIPEEPEVSEPAQEELGVTEAREESESASPPSYPDQSFQLQQANLVSELELEVANLRSELERTKTKHNQDMAKAAGATQATLDTLDRLFNERETAVSVAKQGIVVTEFLHAMALDKTKTSAGALRVDFESKLDDMVRDAFRQTKTTYFQLLLGKVLAFFYSPLAGDALLRMRSSSPTWENLCAIQVAKSAINRGDFGLAVTHLETLESPAADEWVSKAQQALQLWQGAEAAVASMHADLSRVL